MGLFGDTDDDLLTKVYDLASELDMVVLSSKGGLVYQAIDEDGSTPKAVEEWQSLDSLFEALKKIKKKS